MKINSINFYQNINSNLEVKKTFSTNISTAKDIRNTDTFDFSSLNDDTNSSNKLKEQQIAKKIARGQRVSSKDRAYLKKFNEQLLMEADVAHLTKKSLDSKLSHKRKSQSAINIINQEKLSAITDKNTSILSLKLEAIDEIEKQNKYRKTNFYIK